MDDEEHEIGHQENQNEQRQNLKTQQNEARLDRNAQNWHTRSKEGPKKGAGAGPNETTKETAVFSTSRAPRNQTQQICTWSKPQNWQKTKTATKKQGQKQKPGTSSKAPKTKPKRAPAGGENQSWPQPTSREPTSKKR
ncbi:Hypothetical predicted protein [Olea europaea subsp. europaea]|nr:Hypothetical predicted protein [Olea europaea subsp. europaea]